jgi:hypothetical protein
VVVQVVEVSVEAEVQVVIVVQCQANLQVEELVQNQQHQFRELLVIL